MSAVILKKGHIKPLLHRHPWVYASSISRIEGDPQDGDELDVRGPDGRFLARGFYSGHSQLRVRVYAFEQRVALDAALIEQRIAEAQRFRQQVLGLPDERTDAYRVVHGDADRLPGLVIDRFADRVSLQISSVGFERRREAVLAAIEKVLAPTSVHESADPTTREKEGLPPLVESEPAQVEIQERGLKFSVRLGEGQKTGFYCDQRENRALVEKLASGRRVLDGFCYTGGFALSAARGGAHDVTAIDSSKVAIELASKQAQTNGQTVDFIRGDLFKLVGQYRREGRIFDLVLLDPPAYAPNQQSLRKALQKYKELFRLGIQVTAPGGVLLACSCSGAVGDVEFERVLAEAAREAKRSLRVFRRGEQAPDHPVAISCPEGRYLKAYFCQVGA